MAVACLASLSAISFPGMLQCPGTQMRVTSLRVASTVRTSWHSASSWFYYKESKTSFEGLKGINLPLECTRQQYNEVIPSSFTEPSK
jgi:hypothetical protein